MRGELLEPFQLVVEFRSGLRIAVRQIEACDQDAVDRGLEVARLGVPGIAGQRVRVTTGSPPRDRMATPFQAFWPRQDA